MTKEQFKQRVGLIWDFRGMYKDQATSDKRIADEIRPFDPQLATILDKFSNGRLEMLEYLKSKFER